jgi:hypothetical protein
MKPFETTGETAKRHFTIALLVVAFVLSALLTFIIITYNN